MLQTKITTQSYYPDVGLCPKALLQKLLFVKRCCESFRSILIVGTDLLRFQSKYLLSEVVFF